MKVTQITITVRADEKNLTAEELRDIRYGMHNVDWGDIAMFRGIPEVFRELLEVDVRQE